MRVFDASARRKRFFLDLGAVAFKGTEEPPIVVEVGVDSARNSMGIKAVAFRVVELFVAWVVDKKGIGVGAATNNDVVHCLSLIFGTGDLAILVMVEVAYGEKRDL